MEPYEIDSSRMPVRLGSALRVPSYAYPKWGIPEGEFREESDRQYEIEWAVGSPRQMQHVVDAVNISGMGNFSQMLRDANARTVSRLMRDMPGRVNYLETGAGVSTLVLYDFLESEGEDMERIYATLVEPSYDRLESAAIGLEKKGLKRDVNFRTLNTRDTCVPLHIEPYSQDIVTSVAAIHHHAYLDTPVKSLARVLKKDRFIVLSDWHNSMWEHPHNVYKFLIDEFEWETKEHDLEMFAQIYPQCKNPSSGNYIIRRRYNEADKMIRRFWKGWEAVRNEAIQSGTFDPTDDLVMLEAHRPVENYETELKKSGLWTKPSGYLNEVLSENPWPVLPTSNLLFVTVAYKI